MQSNLLSEMKQLLGVNMGNNIPIPSYLFVQRYGREIQDEMQEIARLLGQKDWFFFCSAGVKNSEKLLTGFQMDLERHSGIGKDYAGCILIEVSLKEDKNELEELLDYIHSQKARLHCIYTIKDTEDVKELKELLDNYGFVKVVQGEEYKISEQVEIFLDTLNLYEFEVEEKTREFIVEFLKKQKWQEEDRVKIRIQNMAKETIYNRLLNSNYSDKIIGKDEVEAVLHSNQEYKRHKRQMGFVMGGVELE